MIDETKLIEAFIAHWTALIVSELQWLAERKPRNAESYLLLLKEHSNLSIEAIELLHMILDSPIDLEREIARAPTYRRSGYVRKNNQHGRPTLDKHRVLNFVSIQWDIGPKKAQKIINEVRTFITLINVHTVNGTA
jgi:hypothetical protein